MKDWGRISDGIYRSLFAHADGCELCRTVGDSPKPGVRVHNCCDDGIVLLTDWYLAKCHQKAAP